MKLKEQRRIVQGFDVFDKNPHATTFFYLFLGI